MANLGYQRRKSFSSSNVPPVIDAVFDEFDSTWALELVRGAMVAAQQNSHGADPALQQPPFRGRAFGVYGDYTDCACTPLFSFGHGLGYTTFGYSDITVEASNTSSTVMVGVTVTNTGAREGEEVVQLYVSGLVASVVRPEASLIGFTRLRVPPGEAARVTFDVHPSRLAFYDEAMRFVVEPGRFRFAVGASSSDIRQQAVVDITGPAACSSQRSIVAVTAVVGRTG